MVGNEQNKPNESKDTIFTSLCDSVTHNKNQAKGHLLWFDSATCRIAPSCGQNYKLRVENWVREIERTSWWLFGIVPHCEGKEGREDCLIQFEASFFFYCAAERWDFSTMSRLWHDFLGNSDVQASISWLCRFFPLHCKQQQWLLTGRRHFSASLNQSVFRLLLPGRKQLQHNGLRKCALYVIMCWHWWCVVAKSTDKAITCVVSTARSCREVVDSKSLWDLKHQLEVVSALSLCL